MAVYVDILRNWGWKYGPSCHMIADSVEELKAFAINIGLKESWLQEKKTGIHKDSHFDLTAKMRTKAVSAGAIELDDRHYVAKLWENRGFPQEKIDQLLRKEKAVAGT